MSIQILVDKDTFQSVMYCNTTEIAFGPVFGEDEDPQDFLDWFYKNITLTDPTSINPDTLSFFCDKWRKEVKENEAEAAGERYFSDTAATTLDEVCEKARRLK